MTKLEKIATDYADEVKNGTFYIDTHDFEKQLASDMLREGVLLGGFWMFYTAVIWLNKNAKDFSENADEFIRRFAEAMEE